MSAAHPRSALAATRSAPPSGWVAFFLGMAVLPALVALSIAAAVFCRH